MLTKYISLPIFLISFAIGLAFVYTLGPDIKTIFIYPTPSNYTKYQYKDSAEQCFQFKPNEVDCPFNIFSINSIPVQTN
jgi:hypothetical protein